MRILPTACCILAALPLAVAAAVGQTASISVSVTGSESAGYTAVTTVQVPLEQCRPDVDYYTGVNIGNAEDQVTDNDSVSVSTAAYYFGPGTYQATGSFSGYQFGNNDNGDCTVAAANATTSFTAPSTASTVSSSSGTVDSGQVLTLTPLVAPSAPFIVFPTPTGSVSLLVGSQTVAKANLVPVTSGGNSNARATISASAKGIPPGTYDVQLAYSGDSNYYPSTASITVTVNPAPPPKTSTTTVLSISPNKLVVGDQTTLDAQIEWSSQAAPTGSVTFSSGGLNLGTATVGTDGTGAAILTLSSKGIPPGSYSVTASYSGDSQNLPSVSTPFSVTVVAQSSTATTLSATPLSLTQGQTISASVTVVEKVGNTLPAGTVTFLLNGQGVGTVSLQGGAASLTASTSGIAAGTYSLTAQYNGSATDAVSTSSALSFQILAATATKVTASPNPVTQGNATVISATVMETSGSGIPTGTVAFAYQGNVLGTFALSETGVATLDLVTSGLPKGTDVITASYSGDASNGTSAGTVNLAVQ